MRGARGQGRAGRARPPATATATPPLLPAPARPVHLFFRRTTRARARARDCCAHAPSHPPPTNTTRTEGRERKKPEKTPRARARALSLLPPPPFCVPLHHPPPAPPARSSLRPPQVFIHALPLAGAPPTHPPTHHASLLARAGENARGTTRETTNETRARPPPLPTTTTNHPRTPRAVKCARSHSSFFFFVPGSLVGPSLPAASAAASHKKKHNTHTHNYNKNRKSRTLFSAPPKNEGAGRRFALSLLFAPFLFFFYFFVRER